jgi:hypothetical protein
MGVAIEKAALAGWRAGGLASSLGRSTLVLCEVVKSCTDELFFGQMASASEFEVA